MQPDRFTIKSQEALSAAVTLAATRRHAQVLPEHLLSALLEQDGGLVVPVLRKLGASVDALRSDLAAALAGVPVVSAADEATTSRELLAILRAAEGELKSLKDEYISVEHLLLALAAGEGAAADALRRNGAGPDGVLKALQEV